MEIICLKTSGYNYLGKRHQIPQQRNLKIQSAVDVPANNSLLLWRSYGTRKKTVWLNTDYLNITVDEAYTCHRKLKAQIPSFAHEVGKCFVGLWEQAVFSRLKSVGIGNGLVLGGGGGPVGGKRIF